MRRPRLLALSAAAVGLLAFPLTAWAGHENDPRTKNLHPMGHIFEPKVLGGATFDPVNQPEGDIHTDIAFSGKYAFQGNWDGFNIRDIRAPGNPKQVSRTFCDGNQGDIVVYDNVLVRSWNTPAGTPGAFGAGLTCDGQEVPEGFEGVHIFDISDLSDPELVGSVALRCGSHTASAVPDPENGRLIVYSSGSSVDCEGFDIIEIPLDDPGGAVHVGEVEEAEMMCHDIGVIQGDAMMAACAGHHGFQVWDIGGDAGGSFTAPVMIAMVDVNEVFGYEPDDPGFISIGHSAAFTWDGEVLMFGHEPGGGVAARCQADAPDTDKSAMFFDTDTWEFLGMWTLPRPQGATENCSIHNGNIVPVRSGRYVLVIGNYQAGTWVVDFTDPSNPQTVAWSDPPPAPVPPESPFCCDVTGSWSTYWYNGFIYESNIGEGLNVFRLSGNTLAGSLRLPHLNPQTQEFTIDSARPAAAPAKAKAAKAGKRGKRRR
ncbi:MAG TPA: hypothetical protein VK919_06535 [Solirubrobacterales bacterium]|nr:hypothetical protein [Solirubrobacterales bacterium]